MTTVIPYLVAKARANLGKSPSKFKIKQIIDASSISDAENLLTSYPFYNTAIAQSRPSVDIIKFEAELRKQFAQMLNIYSVAASPGAKSMIEAYKFKLEAENLQILYRNIVGGAPDPDILNYIIPVGKYGMRHYSRILNSATPENSIDFILYPEFKKRVRDAIQRSQTDEELIFYLVSGLEHAAYEFIYKKNKKVKTEIDFLNLETVARSISLGIDSKEWIIQRIGKVARNIDRLARFTSPREVIASMLNQLSQSSQFNEILNTPDKNLISTLEREVDLILMRFHKANFRIFGLSKEALFSFFSLKYAEMKDISKILFGKANNMEPEKIRSVLTYFAS